MVSEQLWLLGTKTNARNQARLGYRLQCCRMSLAIGSSKPGTGDHSAYYVLTGLCGWTLAGCRAATRFLDNQDV